MKIKNLLFLSFMLFGVYNIHSQCPDEFGLHDVVIDFDCDDNYKPCRQYLIHDYIIFHFPENTRPYACHQQPPFPYPCWEELDLYADLDDGNGYQKIPDNLMLSALYDSKGEKRISIKGIIAENEYEEPEFVTYFKGFKITLNITHGEYLSPDIVLDISTSENWDIPTSCSNAYSPGSPFLTSTVGEAKAYIKYGAGHAELIKPFIFVDGLDFGSADNRVIDPVHNNIVRYGRNGWDALIRGSVESFIDYAGGDRSEFALYPQQFQDLLDEGYDLVFLDFERGSDYIQKNGLLLRELILRINDELKVIDPVSGRKNENIVVGASMGGQIAKYTLAKMEQDGENHCTRTYVSFDSPQKGANIAIGLQATAWYFYALAEATPDECDNNNDAQKSLWEKLNEPAPRQLLLETFGGLYSNGDISIERWAPMSDISATLYDLSPPDPSINYECLRQDFVTTMETLGYPQKTRNLAISCGSGIGTDQGYNGNDRLFNAKIYANEGNYGTVFRLGIFGNQGGDCGYNVQSFYSCISPSNNHNINETDVLFAAAQPVTFQSCPGGWFPLFGGFPDDYQSALVKKVNPTPSFDNAPGCNRYDLLSLENDLQSALESQGDNLTITNNVEQFTQCFMPTMSTLDIDWEINDQNMWRDIDDENIVALELTPFQAYYAPENNLKHVEMDQGMLDWVNAELAASAVNLSTTLPSLEGTTYNFGNPSRKLIPSVMVNDGGYLRINYPGPTGYGNEIDFQKELFQARTSFCSGDIIVNDGGSFILGNDDVTNNISRKAELRVMDGASVRLNEGGKLRLTRGSKLIIEDGATLEINNGAEVDLWWAESNIHIKSGGRLIVNGTIRFSGSGFFQFDEGHIFEQNAKWEMQGEDERFIRLNKGAVLPINQFGAEFRNGGVEYQANSSIETAPGARVDMRFMKFDGVENEPEDNIGFNINEASTVIILNCDFDNLNTALYINNTDIQVPTNIWHSNFNNNIIGVYAEHSPGIFINESDFTPGSVPNSIAVSFQDMSRAAIFSSTFTDYNPQNLGAINATNVERLFLSNTDITNNNTGLVLEDVLNCRISGGLISGNTEAGVNIPIPADGSDNESNVFLFSQAKVNNNAIGVHFEAGGGQYPNSTDLFGMFTMDCAELYNNDVGVEGTDVILNIDAFINSNTDETELAYTRSNKIHGLGTYFKICYVELGNDIIGSTIPASGNYWGGVTSPSQVQSRIKVKKSYEGSGCIWTLAGHILDLGTMVSTEPVGCPEVPSDPTPNPEENPSTFTEIGVPPDGYAPIPGQGCTLASNSTFSSNDEVHYDGYTQYRAGLFTSARQEFAKTASVSTAERSGASDVCKHYINVAKVMARGNSPLLRESNAEETENKSLSVFPNPTNRDFTVIYNYGSFYLKVFDLMGRPVHTGFYQSQTELTTDGWISGVYILEIRGKDSKEVLREKVMVLK